MKTSRLALVLISMAIAPACGGSDKPPAKAPTDALDETPKGSTTATAGLPPRSGSVTQGIDLLQKGQLEDARALFAQAVQKTPSDLEANYYLAVTYEKLNDRKAAETYYKRSLEIAPGDSGSSVNLSALYVEDNKNDEAIALCNAAMAKSPNLDKLHFNLARALAQKGDEAASTNEFEKTMKLGPDVADYHLAYGQYLAKWNKRDKGLEQIHLALSMAKEDPDLLLGVGRALRVLRVPTECVEVFTRAIAQKDSPNARTERAMCKMAMKDIPGAETDFRAATTADPLFPPAHYWLGVLLAAKGDTKGAVAELETVQRLQPDGDLAKQAAARIAKIKGH